MKTQRILIAILSIALFTTVTFAQQSNQSQKAKLPVSSTAKVDTVDISGTLECLGCSLGKAEGARSACSVYGHEYVLKTADGKYINLLKNKYSADLIKGDKYAHKQIIIHGILHHSANLLDIESFVVDGKAMSWCDGHNAMDQCHSASGMK